MSYITKSIRLYKRDEDDDSWETSYTSLTNPFNMMINIASGSKKDSFKFDILNSHNMYFSPVPYFEKTDKIQIYMKLNSQTVSSSDLLFDGIITNIMEDMGDHNILHIEGKSRTEQLLEGLTVVTTSGSSAVNTILQTALNYFNDHNRNYQITWKSTNPSTTSTGSAFPYYFEAAYYKPVNQIFEQYSSNTYTKDGNYYFYVNENNEMIWGKQTNTVDYTLSEEECESIRISDKSDEVVNSVVTYCGFDPKGEGIRAYYFDYESRVKYGAKWKFITAKNDTGQAILQNEKDTNSGSFTADSNFPSAYPYTTTFGTSCANASAFVNAIRVESENRANSNAKKIVQALNESRISIVVTLPLTLGYSIASVVQISFPYYNLSNKQLRIEEIQYTDYNTILYLKEDERL